MSAPTIKTSVNGTGMQFGISDITIAGVELETVEIDISAQIDVTATDQQGLVAAWALGGKQGTVNATGYMTGNQADIGEDFTVAIGNVSATASITNVKPSKSNKDFGKVNITAKFYDGVA